MKKANSLTSNAEIILGVHPALSMEWQEKAVDNTISLKELMENPPKSPEWLIEDILPKKGIVLIGGAPASYKSTTAAHMSAAVADGSLLFDYFETKKGIVLYINEENSPEIFYRLIGEFAGDLQNSQDIATMHLKGVVLDEDKDGKWMERLRELIQNTKPDLIILDSMVRAMEGDENSAKDVRRVFKAVSKLTHEFGGCWVILHHMRKGGNDKNALRGSGDFLAMADMIYTVHRKGNKAQFRIKQEKCRLQMEMEPFNVAVRTSDSRMWMEHMGITKDETESGAEICLELLGEWAKKHKTFRTKEVHAYIATLNDSDGERKFTETTVKTALKLGLKEGKWRKIKQGKYELVG